MHVPFKRHNPSRLKARTRSVELSVSNALTFLGRPTVTGEPGLRLH